MGGERCGGSGSAGGGGAETGGDVQDHGADSAAKFVTGPVCGKCGGAQGDGRQREQDGEALEAQGTMKVLSVLVEVLSVDGVIRGY